MAKSWTDVESSEGYKSLEPAQREAARQQYFSEVVAPQVPSDKLDQAREQFLADTTPQENAAWKLTKDLGRQVGLTARAGIQGLANIPGMLANVPAAIYNETANLGNRIAGSERGFRFPDQTQFGVRLSDLAGLPQAENATERISQDVAGAMAGQGGMISLAKIAERGMGPEFAKEFVTLQQRLAKTFSSQQGLQITSAGTGAGGASAAREGGFGPWAQMGIGLGTSMIPSLAGPGASMSLRALARGGEEGRQNMAGNIRQFEEAGYGTPSVGQATENRGMRAVESTLAKTPGGAGQMAAAAERGAENLGSKIDELADSLSRGATATKAGTRIESGVKSFVEGFRNEQGMLYDKLDASIPKNTPVDLTNTINKLSELNASIPGAPETSKFFKNSTIQAIEQAIKADTADFTTRLPYEALKKLRTLVGAELENTTLTSSVPRSKWKSLYGALSEDLGEAATAAGPEAQRAFKRANDYTRAGHERIGVYLDRVAGRDTAEKVFQAAVNPSEIKEGASTINAVMRSLKNDDRKVLQAAFLKRMGEATPGTQDDLGASFSPNRFLTNWNKISPEAKRTLFADSTGTLRADLDKIASVASNLREGSKVFANPSGTQQAISAQAPGWGALVALLTGHPGLATIIGGTPIAANASARLMTNPKFVHWLAQSSENPTGAIPALQGIAQGMDMEDRGAADEYIKAAKRLQLEKR